MNERRSAILKLIGEQPNIRLIEISDKLDIDPDQIVPLIREDINSGLIVTSEIEAPNGRMQPCFLHTQIPAKPADAPFVVPTFGKDTPTLGAAKPLPAIDVPVALKPGVPLVSKPAPAPVPTARKTKIELAIEYLRENGPVTSPFLSRAIGLDPKTAPHSYINAAIKDGRIIFKDKEWSLAVLPAEMARTEAAGKQAPPVQPVAVPEPVAVPVPVTAPRMAMVPLAPSSGLDMDRVEAREVKPDPAAEKFVMGLFSTGELVIEQDGREIRLKPENAAALVRYVRKIEPVVLSD